MFKSDLRSDHRCCSSRSVRHPHLLQRIRTPRSIQDLARNFSLCLVQFLIISLFSLCLVLSISLLSLSGSLSLLSTLFLSLSPPSLLFHISLLHALNVLTPSEFHQSLPSCPERAFGEYLYLCVVILVIV